MTTKRFSSAVLLGCACLLGGCTVGPDYKRPQVDALVPPAWGWKMAEPSDQVIKGDWWRAFNDPVLDDLETRATAANQRVQVAMARVDQSRAAAGITDSRFWPQLGFDPSISRFHTQLNHVPSDLTATAYTIPLDLSYEVDLWGKIRRASEAAGANAQASEADFYNVLLTVHGDVAVNYFLLRQLDTQIGLLQRTVGLRENSVRIVTERFRGGLAPELDVERAQTDFAQNKTALLEAGRQRDNLEHALALLCGQPAPAFRIKSMPLAETLPVVPLGLPSSLLERRPDVAEAERRMMVANASIGVAKAAFFPAITLTGQAGYSSFNAGNLLEWQSHLFQVGPGVTLPLLNGGRLKAGLAEARAAYQAACAGYRETVLSAFKDVTDSVTDLDGYSQEAATEAEALAAANRALDTARERYRQGLVNYLDVLDVERTQLQVESETIKLDALRLVASVRLVKALGGGFEQNEKGEFSLAK